MNTEKEKGSLQKQEAIQITNLEKKNNIINEIKELIDQNQIDSKTYKKFRALQRRVGIIQVMSLE